MTVLQAGKDCRGRGRGGPAASSETNRPNNKVRKMLKGSEQVKTSCYKGRRFDPNCFSTGVNLAGGRSCV